MQLTTLITVSRAAKILDLSEGGVRALERRGELPATRTSTGTRLFDPAIVERVARERAARAAAIVPGAR
jgi:DNA-binding transcriptional MerR regulator